MPIAVIEVDCHISIKKDGISFLSAMKTELLKEIYDSGSLRGAAKKLKISYQKTLNMKPILIHPIGVIRTPHADMKNMPIQPIAAEGIRGHLEVMPTYVEGLKDLDGFSHITLIYHFHKIEGYDLEVVPFMDDKPHGIFATKAPKRPNAIGISTVKLISVKGNIVEIEQVDMLDGTPLLDIKPFYPRYDNRADVSIGWLEKNKDLPVEEMRADERFK